MSDRDLSSDSFAAELVAALDPSARQALAKELAKTLRTSQQKRIAAQQNPDGSGFVPRKPQLRHRVKKLRKTMFAKLRTTKYLKATGTPEAAVVSFTREVERIARVHQLGLRDLVNRKKGIEATYPARQLLGLTDDEETVIREVVTSHLASRL